MSALTEFAAHCRIMSTAEHKPECQGRETEGPWQIRITHPAPDCYGCNPAADRALFARLADEIDAHLAPVVDLFGDAAMEPTTEDA